MTGITRRLNGLYAAASRTSRPVWAFLILETLIAGALVVAGGGILVRLVQATNLGELPPWRALAWCPFVGVAGHVTCAMRPIEVARRWQGVAVRRIDERWAADR